MPIERLPLLESDAVVTRDVLVRLLERADRRDVPALLQSQGWLWTDDEHLLLPRAQLVGLVGLVLGEHGVLFDAATVVREAAKAHGATSAQAADWAAVAACAWAAGAARRLVDDTVSWVGTRQQFGKPVGRQQAVQHRAVDMHVDAEAMYALVWATVGQVDAAGGGLCDVPAVDALADFCWRASRRVGQAAIQLHGAIAMTAELPVGGLVLAAERLLTVHAQPLFRTARRAAALRDRNFRGALA
jgi:Acyl-CoA dehydrogenase, C-terminal domain